MRGTAVESLGHLPCLYVEPEGVIAGEIVGGAGKMTPIAIKSEIGRLLIEVPLARHGGEIARVNEDFGYRGSATECVATGLIAVEPREQRDARGVALCRVVKLCKAQTVGRQGVKIRGGNLGAIAAKVGESQIIRHNEKNVRTACSILCRGKQRSDRITHQYCADNKAHREISSLHMAYLSL